MTRPIKLYVWMLLNFVPNEEDIADDNIRLSVTTITLIIPRLKHFTDFLVDRGLNTFADARTADLDAWAEAVDASSLSVGEKQRELLEVKRLWKWRGYLPRESQLPAEIPWDGRSPAEILGELRKNFENRTPRIDELTLNGLLAWSLRFVEIFSTDIVPSAVAYRPLVESVRRHDAAHWRRRGVAAPDSRADDRPSRLERTRTLIDRTRADGMKLPGREVNGKIELDLHQISRLLDTRSVTNTSPAARLLRESGIEIAGFAPLTAATQAALLDGKPWLPRPMAFNEVAPHERRLRTACLVVIAYLSGMRPGEVLNLRRGCVEQIGLLWAVNGRAFKAVRDNNRQTLPEGEDRPLPWIVTKSVVDAIRVLESLHDGPLLFPAKNLRNDANIENRAIRSSAVNVDIALFADWVNGYCASTGRPDFIPRDDAHPIVTMMRFRRTLAWHICRRPRGLVAAAIQYGHLFTQVTQGYGGTAESGFPDEYSFERFLGRMDDLGQAQERLTAGEKVSGPAADRYRVRVNTAVSRFEGMFVATAKQARTLLNNPELQIFQGRSMTCVYDPSKALCKLRQVAGDAKTTPDLTDCQSGCQNVARTDTDIMEVRKKREYLLEVVGDPLAPPIRVQREVRELERLDGILKLHDLTNPDRVTNGADHP